MPATPKPDDLSPSTLAADWQRMKSEMTPKPDTSPANVARVLREAAACSDVRDTAETCRALADALDRQTNEAIVRDGVALDQQAAAPTSPELSRGDLTVLGAPWEDRLRKATNHLQDTLARRGAKPSKALATDADWLYATNAALIAAFPELAPADD